MTLLTRESSDDLSTPLEQVTFVVLDVETTGGSPIGSALTEVAAARYRSGELLGTFQTLVRPDRPDRRIPPFVSGLTGITDAMLVDAPPVETMLPSLLEFIGGGVLVGHNLRFDIAFIDHALTSTAREPLANHTVDTLAMARRLVRDLVPNCRLATLAATLDLPHRPSHRALPDVLATGDLLHALLERAGTFGIVALDELLRLPKLVGHPEAHKLKFTARLPSSPGVYWFCDGAGHILHVDDVTDLRAAVRSHFDRGRRTISARLLKQLGSVRYRVHAEPAPAPAPGRPPIVLRDRAWPGHSRRGLRHQRQDALTVLAPRGKGVAGAGGLPRPGPWESYPDRSS